MSYSAMDLLEAEAEGIYDYVEYDNDKKLEKFRNHAVTPQGSILSKLPT